jgi:hypothetical protein
VELEKVSSDIDRLWTKLRSVTPARIGLARSGSWVETKLLLDFQLAHAEAQDAVKDRLDADRLISDMICLSSKAPDRKLSRETDDGCEVRIGLVSARGDALAQLELAKENLRNGEDAVLKTARRGISTLRRNRT